jgi:diguanylate cyclase (GGDEF)-like protein
LLNWIRAGLRRLEDSLTLRQQVAIETATLSVFLVACLAIVASMVSRNQIRESVNADLSTLAEGVASQLNAGLAMRLGEAAVVADLLSRFAELSEGPALAEVVEAARTEIEHASWVAFTDPEGRVLVASGASLNSPSVAQKPWFRRNVVEPAAGGLYEEPAVATSVAGASPKVMPLQAPVTRNGRLAGYLLVLLPLDWAEQIRLEVLASLEFQSETRIRILNGQGEVLLGEDPGTRLLPEDGSASVASEPFAVATRVVERERSQGSATAASATAAMQSHLIVLASRSAALADSQANGLGVIIICFGALIASIGVACAALIAQRVARPLLEITSEAYSMRSDPERALPRVRGSADVIQLSLALREMVRRILTAERRSEEAEKRAAFEALRFSKDIEDLRQLADTDPLTTLPNRRGFMMFADDVLRYFHRYRRRFAMIMIDIDFFKRINDTYGHDVGDVVIATVGKLIASEIRPTDKCARFGGEEFLVLLRETNSDDALATAERLRRRVESTPIHAGDVTVAATISLGVAVVVRPDLDIDGIIARADQALYVAKSGGRNRVAGGGLDGRTHLAFDAA